jgi:hypothetical protein
MTFTRDEAMLVISPTVRQAYVDSLREGILALAQQTAADRDSANRALAERVADVLTAAVLTSALADLPADWSPGPAISEGSSHGNLGTAEVITIDSPPTDMPSTLRPDQEPEVELSPSHPVNESAEIQGTNTSQADHTNTATAGEALTDDVDMRHADAADYEPYAGYGHVTNMWEAEALVPQVMT